MQDCSPCQLRLCQPRGRGCEPGHHRFEAKAQAQIDQLARKCNEGRLTDDERREYETYVQTIDFLAILQAKARAAFRP